MKYQGSCHCGDIRFDVEGDLTDERLDQVRDAAEKLLANTVIEAFDIRVEQ